MTAQEKFPDFIFPFELQSEVNSTKTQTCHQRSKLAAKALAK